MSGNDDRRTARIRTPLTEAAKAASRPSGWWLLWASLVFCFAIGSSHAQGPLTPQALLYSAAEPAPITPIPEPPAADPHKLALGEMLFRDNRLSHDDSLSCASCHDLHTNGASSWRVRAQDGSVMPFTVLSVFNAALSFRLNWEGNFRTLEEQAEFSLENPANMATNVPDVLSKLRADPAAVQLFRDAYGHPPDRFSLLDAIAVYERSLVTPDSRFDQFLRGNESALTPQEQRGYGLFQSLGCVSCHQGVNIGGNLFQRHGIFHPLASPNPKILRVPSLRNVATVAPYFHDGSAPTLEDAVRKMADAQLDQTLSADDLAAIVAFLKTLTGEYQGVPVKAPP